jgi:hypothetical protein
MTEQAAQTIFDIHMEILPDGRLTSAARGNLNPSFIIAQLEILKMKLLSQMEQQAGTGQLMATRSVPGLKINRMP